MKKETINPMHKMWFVSQIAKHQLNYRDVAYALLNKFIEKRTGLSIHDLPDTMVLCDALDELEGLIESEQYDSAMQNAYYYCGEIVDTIMD
jgi:hypothetical protein